MDETRLTAEERARVDAIDLVVAWEEERAESLLLVRSVVDSQDGETPRAKLASLFGRVLSDKASPQERAVAKALADEITLAGI